MMTGLAVTLVELVAAPDTDVEEADVEDVFVQDEDGAGAGKVEPLH